MVCNGSGEVVFVTLQYISKFLQLLFFFLFFKKWPRVCKFLFLYWNYAKCTTNDFETLVSVHLSQSKYRAWHLISVLKTWVVTQRIDLAVCLTYIFVQQNVIS